MSLSGRSQRAVTLGGDGCRRRCVPAVVVGAAVAAVIIVHRHRGNLGRLFAGTERRIGERLL